jgi:hypothetical protein
MSINRSQDSSAAVMLEGKSATTIDIRTFVAANPQHGLFDTMYKAYLYSTQRGTCLLFQGQDIQMEPRVGILTDAPIVLAGW